MRILLQLFFLRVAFPGRRSFSWERFAWGGVRHDWGSFARRLQKCRRNFEYEPD